MNDLETKPINHPERHSLIPDPPVQLYVYTKEHGVTTGHTTPGFDHEAERLEGYDLQIPPEVTAICEKIRGLGGRALLVGGCVRDCIINKEHPEAELKPKDFDIEVYGLSPELLHMLLESEFGAIDTAGKAFEVLKVSIPNWDEPLDFSIPRRDSKTGKGHDGFTVTGDPTMSIAEAALRRDITINSLAYDPLHGVVYDAFGGVEDIRRGIIDVTDERTFTEDPLRVLRVMQFAARFDFEVSERTTELCAEMVERGDLDDLPKERITEEVKKLMVKGEKPSRGMTFAREIGVTERYWPELHALIDVPQEFDWHPEGDVWVHTLQVMDAAVLVAKREELESDDRLLLVLSALCHDLGKPATTQFIEGKWRARGHEEAGVEPSRTFLDRFTLSEGMVRKILALVPDHLKPKTYYDLNKKEGTNMDRALRRLAVRLYKGDANLYMLGLLVEADQRGRNGKRSLPLADTEVPELTLWRDWLKQKTQALHIETSAPSNLLGGKDLIEAGIQPGVWFHCILESVYLDQIDGDIGNRTDALSKALDYHHRFTDLAQSRSEREGITLRKVWEEWTRVEDPRQLLT